ncbi:MAG: carboxypeptidase-like regulatory domain-containing protein [Bacteroidota bacterium]
MKKILFVFSVITGCLIMTPVFANMPLTQPGDTISHITVTGKIIDNDSEKPVVFASIYLDSGNKGTVSNSEGEYVLKIPRGKINQVVEFSHLGYKTLQLPARELITEGENIIRMESSSVTLDEITVKPEDALAIINSTLKRVKDNYPLEPVILTGFYRETIKQNRKYVSVTEALVDIYKAPYFPTYQDDQLKIFKGKKSQDVEKMDTVLVKLQGGPSTVLYLDIVKNPYELIETDIQQFYDYNIEDIVNMDGKETFVISFDQKKGVKYPLFSGKIYIDRETYAIRRADFGLSEKGLDYATGVLVKKKPLFMNVEPTGANYLANYKEIDGKLYLNYVRAEAQFKIKWKRKLFNTRIYTMSEMAIIDRDTTNVNRFKYRETARPSDVFADEVGFYEDKNFWGEYNYIKPEESIQEAILKIEERLNRSRN